VRQILRGGLEKSLALKRAEKLSGLSRTRMAIIDDRQHNIDALRHAGIGLALKAPSALSADHETLVTFDLAVALATFQAWSPGPSPRAEDLPAQTLPIEPWRRSGLSTAMLERHIFNRARRIGFRLRHALGKR
jgi:hypothetical protein